MSSGKWRPFCLGLNGLSLLKIFETKWANIIDYVTCSRRTSIFQTNNTSFWFNSCIDTTNDTPNLFCILLYYAPFVNPKITSLTYCSTLHISTVWIMFHYLLKFGQVWWLNGLPVCGLQNLRILTYILFDRIVTCQNFYLWLDFFWFFFFFFLGGGGGGGGGWVGVGWRWVLVINKRPWLGCFTLPRQGIGGGLHSLGSLCSHSNRMQALANVYWDGMPGQW